MAKDTWDKVDIASRVFSGVVIAVVGAAISISIQRAQIRASAESTKAQIEAARLTAGDQKKVAEAQLTAQFLRSLLSADAKEREIATVALSSSLDGRLAEDILAIVATKDNAPAVRAAAIEQLGNSSRVESTRALSTIANSDGRAASERLSAAIASRVAGLRQFLSDAPAGGGSFLLASNNDDFGYGANASDSRWVSTFAAQVQLGLDGSADLNKDGRLYVSELQRFVTDQLQAKAAQTLNRGIRAPVVASKGRDFVLEGVGAPYSKAVGAFYNISDYDDGHDNDVDTQTPRRIADVLTAKIGLSVRAPQTPLGRDNFLQSLSTVASAAGPDDLLVVYWGGSTVVSGDGLGRWLLYSPGRNDFVTGPEFSDYLRRSAAKYKLVIIDSAFDQAPPARRQ